LLLKELPEEAHRNIMRLSQTKFDDLKMVTPTITKINTPIRNAIPSKTKLEITMRYLASNNLMTLEYLFRIPHNTIPYAS